LKGPRQSPTTAVFLTVFIDLLGFGIVIPLLPLYAEHYQPTPMQFGLLMSSYSVMQFLFAPVLGRLSDRIGRRPVLLGSLLGTVAGYLLFAFAGSLTVLFASRIIDGITGGNIGTAQAVIADTTSGSDRARGMGLIGMAFGLGFIFGPALGGFTVHLGAAAPGLAAAALSFLAFLWTLFRLPETRPADAAVRPFEVLSVASVLKTARRPAVGTLLVMSLLTATAFANFEATFSQFLKARFGFTPASVAWVFVMVGVVSAVVQGGLLKPLVARVGEVRLILAGAVALSAAFVLMIGVSSLGLLAFTAVLLAIGTALINPSMMGYVSRMTPPTEQGAVLGSFQSMAALGRIVGPFWGENVFLRFGAVGPYGTGIVLEAAALVLGSVGLLRRQPKEEGGA
jgi:MFS transporter, DHA1 family, tetracycline resistance protein